MTKAEVMAQENSTTVHDTFSPPKERNIAASLGLAAAATLTVSLAKLKSRIRSLGYDAAVKVAEVAA